MTFFATTDLVKSTILRICSFTENPQTSIIFQGKYKKSLFFLSFHHKCNNTAFITARMTIFVFL